MTTAFLTISVLALTVAVLINSLNKLQCRRNAALAALAALREHIEIRRKAILNMAENDEDLLKSGVFAALKNAPITEKSAGAAAMAATEAQFERLIESLAPQMKAQQKKLISEAGHKTDRAAAHYNRCVCEYNTALSALPAAFFARLYKFKRFEVF